MIRRYEIFYSNEAMSWTYFGHAFFLKTAKQIANNLAAGAPWLFVQVNDRWRKSKMVHFIKADLNAIKARRPNMELVKPKCCDQGSP